MENASKALIMAASVLVGIMIISVGVALFNSFSGFGKSTTEKIEETKIAEWNNNYLKYEGLATITAHDIISVTNHAKQNNTNYDLQDQNKYDENSYYVQVQVGKEINFEKKTEEEKNEFLRENSLTEDNQTKYYSCAEIKLSNITKRVVYIRFEEQK